eukprot:jgi/Ulvmu1/7639/UM038_0066.1
MGRGRGGYGGGGRGRGHRRGPPHQGRHGYQKGFIAPPPREVSARAAMLRILNSLGSAPAISARMSEEEQRAVESFVAHQMLDTYGQVMDGINNHPLSMTVDSFWDVLLTKPQRVPFFAVLVSLLNRTAVQASEAIVTEAGKRLSASLSFTAQGDPGTAPSCNHITKAVLRFYCGLGTLGVVSCSSVISRFQEFVDKAMELVGGEADESAASRQAYADMLVEAVLLALPWGGKALFDQEQTAAEALLQRVQDYTAARPKKTSTDLAPWLPLRPDAPPRISADCSGASFLPTLLAAVEELRQASWLSSCVPQPHHYIDNAFNVGAVFDAPVATFPTAPPPSLSAAQIHPARGLCPLLPDHLDRAPADALAIDVIIAQEYYLHVLHAYASNGKACVDEATSGLPIPFPSVYLLVELIMSQILLPAPPLLVFAYHSLMVRLVELVGQPVAMSFGGCVKTIFESAEDLDMILLHRVSDALAWFVSNNNYQWPWARWERVLDAGPLDAQRRFCSLTLAKMIRLCAQLQYIQQKALPPGDRWLLLVPASDQASGPPPDPSMPHGLQQPYDDFMAALVSKADEATVEAQLRVAAEAADEGGLRDTLAAFLHVLLVRAAVSQYHTEVLLDRYRNALKNIMASVNEEASAGTAESAALDAATKVWKCSSLRANLTISRYVSAGLMTVQDVLTWVFTPAAGAKTAVPKLVDEDEATATAALECISSLLTALIDKAQASADQLRDVQAQLPQLQAEAEAAAAEMQAAQAEAQDAGVTDEEREALMERIPVLTTAESHLAASLQAARERKEQVETRLHDQKARGQEAMDGLFERCMRCVVKLGDDIQEHASDDSKAETLKAQKLMLVNAFASLARHFASMAGGAVNVVQAVRKSIEACQAPVDVVDLVQVVLPGLKTDAAMAATA